MDAALQKTLLGRMLLIRTFEERLTKPGLPMEIHTALATGQEATCVGMGAALNETDYLTCTYRSDGDLLAKGADPKRLMAEIFGRSDGFCRGKAGHVHVFEPKKGIIGANGIVGAGIPIATGAALAAKLEGKGRVAAASFGDGASNQGAFHESLNLAAVWKLPVIYVCVNNGYGEFTAHQDASAVVEIRQRAVAYDIPGVRVDGNDVEAVYGAMLTAVNRARAGEGPTLLECVTYRWHGHFSGESHVLGKRKYRDPAEIQSWKERDPIVAYRRKLVSAGVLSEAEADAMVSEAEAEVESALKFAAASPLPVPEEALENLFASA